MTTRICWSVAEVRGRIFTLLVSFLFLLLVGGLVFLSQLQPFGSPSQRQVLKIPVGSSFSDAFESFPITGFSQRFAKSAPASFLRDR